MKLEDNMSFEGRKEGRKEERKKEEKRERERQRTYMKSCGIHLARVHINAKAEKYLYQETISLPKYNVF